MYRLSRKTVARPIFIGRISFTYIALSTSPAADPRALMKEAVSPEIRAKVFYKDVFFYRAVDKYKPPVCKGCIMKNID